MTNGKRIVAFFDRLVDRVVILILLIMMLFGIYSIYDSDQVYSAADAGNYTVFKPTVDDSLTFDELKVINSEVIGWLTVNETPIDYPVVQAEDNDKYIDTTAEGDYSLSGAIFLDYRNSRDFSDFNSIIFGHHMEQEKMFGSLSNFGKKDYFDEHPYGDLYYAEDGSHFSHHGLEFFAVILTDAYDFDLYTPAVTGEDAKEAYLQHIYDIAMYTRSLPVGTEDRIVLLSTCTTEITNGRYLLVGKITDTIHPEKVKFPANIIGPGTDAIRKYPMGAMILLLLLFLILLLLLILLKKRKEKKQKKSGEAQETDQPHEAT